MAIIASAMVIGLFSGMYAGLGLSAPQALDRNAELWFGGALWTVAIVGALVRGNLGMGLALGGLAILVMWSFLHFPQMATLQTPTPRLFPLFSFLACLVTAILLGVAIALSEVT